jgi:hypothetical protein
MRSFCALALLLSACGDNHDSTTLTLQDVSVTTAEDTSALVDVPFTASDRNNTTLEVMTAPQHGTLTGAGPRWTYQPAENYAGADSFVVRAQEGSKSAMATVTIDVTAVNDPPVANADSFPAGFETPLAVAQTTLLANDTDVESATLSVASVSGATHGTVALSGTEVVFTPEAGYTGTASFMYAASDGEATAMGMVTVTIGDDIAPVAVDDTATTDEDVTLVLADSVVLANDTDAENHTLAIDGVAGATNGTVTHAGTDITFVPAPNFHGTATFTYTVTDGFKTDVGTVTVTVTPVNDDPVAVADSATTLEDTALPLTAASLLANDTDVDLDTLTITAVGTTATTNGTVTLAGTDITYTPAANFNGAAAFTYTVSDGNGGTAIGTVNVTVTAVQDVPVAVDDSLTTPEDTAAVFAASTLTTNDTDPDGDTLTVTSVTGTVDTHGSVSLAGGNVTYTPALNYNGPASFTYVIGDGNGGVASATVNITVTPVDDAPTAVDDAVTVAEASTNNVINVLVNDTDSDGGTNTVTAVTAPAHGTAAVGAGGANVTYTPASGYCNQGPNEPRDSFTYTLNGGSTATVFVTVTCACGLGKPTTFVVGGI